MSTMQNKQAAIFVEETHRFEVTLGDLSDTQWKEGKGVIEIKLPYDGTIFKEDMSGVERLALGEILVKMRDGDSVRTDTWPISAAAGKNWDYYLKSAKRAVCRAEYEIQQPQEILLSVQGEVRDMPPLSLAEEIQLHQRAFQNALQLYLSLWLPDLYRTRSGDKTAEINRLLLRREHTQQIFMQKTSLNFEQNLAENLAALANTYGGIILVGVNENGKVHGLSAAEAENMPYHVLQALLQIYPNPPLQRAELCQTGRGQVYLLKVGSNERGVVYAKGTVYRREKKKNVQMAATTASPPPPIAPYPKSLTELLPMDDAGQPLFKFTDKVATLEVLAGLKDLRLGRYVCGMINAHLKVATLVLRSPRQMTTTVGNFTQKQIESYVKSELDQINPKVHPGNIAITTTESHSYAIITIPIEHIPVALYGKEGKEAGHVWHVDGRLESIPVADLLSNYLSGAPGANHNQSPVNLESAFVTWPIRPPEKVQGALVPANDKNIPAFSVQHQALVWQPDTFNRETNTTGYQISLELPLHHAALMSDDNGQLTSHSPVARGEITICLEDMLISGCDVSVPLDEDEVEKEDNYLWNLPIIKRTRLCLNFTAYLSQLFKQRTRWSYLEFSLLEVMPDRERVRDMIKTCADIGFRLFPAAPRYSVPELGIPEIHAFGEKLRVENNRLLILNGAITGIRSNQYLDINLYLGWSSTHANVTRELHYEDVHDTGISSAYTISYHIYLWGKDEARAEIGQLQMRLYELLRRRLQQVGAE